MSSKFSSEHLAGQTFTFAEVKDEGPKSFTGSNEPLDLNCATDPMAGTIPVPLGEYPQGSVGWEKA